MKAIWNEPQNQGAMLNRETRTECEANDADNAANLLSARTRLNKRSNLLEIYMQNKIKDNEVKKRRRKIVGKSRGNGMRSLVVFHLHILSHLCQQSQKV